jgi:hypothetical protein
MFGCNEKLVFCILYCAVHVLSEFFGFLFFGCVITTKIWSSLLARSCCSDLPTGFYFGLASRPGLGRPPAGQVSSVRW